MSFICMIERNDVELLEMARNGDLSAFELLFKKHHQTALNIAFRIVGSVEAAEDIVMEAFLKIYSSGHKIKTDFNAYFYRIVVNKSLNFTRRNKRISTEIDLDYLSSDSENPLSEIINKDAAKEAFKALDSLPPAQKTAFILLKYEELSYKEAADIMNISVKALESLMSRAKEKLRKYYFGAEKNEQ